MVSRYNGGWGTLPVKNPELFKTLYAIARKGQ